MSPFDYVFDFTDSEHRMIFASIGILLWIGGWYAKAHPVFGLVVAAFAFPLMTLLFGILFVSLLFVVGLPLSYYFESQYVEFGIAIFSALATVSLFIYYAITAREMRHMVRDHSIRTTGTGTIREENRHDPIAAALTSPESAAAFPSSQEIESSKAGLFRTRTAPASAESRGR